MIQLTKKLQQLCLALTGVLLLGSCNLDELPDFDNTYLPNYEGSIALLLVNDTVTIREFLEENITDTSTYDITSEERIIFSYDIDTDFDVGSDFVEIQDFSNRRFIASPIEVPFVAPKDTSFTISRKIAFNFPATKDEQLDSLYYLDADFILEFNSGFPTRVDYEFSTPSFISLSTGDSIVIGSSVDPFGAPPAIETTTRSLAGFKTNLISETDSNMFFVNLHATVFLEAGDALSGNEYINLDLEIANPEFDVIFGAFGQDTFNVDQQRVDLSFFEDLGGEGIVFESPRIEFTISNGFGLPVEIDFSQVYANYADGDPMLFDVTEAQLVQAASVDNFGEVVSTTLTIDENNSNIREILASSPTEMIFNLAGYSNPDGMQPNWMGDESAMDISAKVSIPLSFSMDGFEFDNEIDLDDLSDLEGTQDLTLLVNTISEFPFDGELSLYMLDEDSVLLSSVEGSMLFTTPTQFDSNGKVLEPSTNTAEISLDSDQIDALINAATLKMVVKLNSFEGRDFVEVFADYEMQIKIGLSGTVSVDLNGN